MAVDCNSHAREDVTTTLGELLGLEDAAETVLRRPDLAAWGMAQSGSYWFGSEGTPGTGRGHLLRRLEDVVPAGPSN